MVTGTRKSQKQRETKPSVARAAVPQPGSTHGQTGGPATAGFDEERRHHMIEEAAYFIAERRGFCKGLVLDDWLAAEAEIDRQFPRKDLS